MLVLHQTLGQVNRPARIIRGYKITSNIALYNKKELCHSTNLCRIVE